MGVPVLHRVVIGRQCSWFPVDVTEKTKNVGHIVRVLVPLWSRMIRGFWAERLSCGVGVTFRFVSRLLVGGWCWLQGLYEGL